MKPFAADSLMRLVVQTVLIGVPLAVILAWFVDLRRDIRPVGGRDLNQIEEEERLRTTSLVKMTLLFVAVLSGTFVVGAMRAVVRAETAVDHRRVVIMPFDNRTRDAGFDRLGDAAAARIAERLRPLTELEVLPQKAAGSAGVIVGGSYYFHTDSIRFGVQLTDAVTGELLRYFVPAAVPRQAALYYMPRLSQEVSDTIARHFQRAR